MNTAKDPLFEPLKPYKQSPMTREYRKYSNPEGDIMGHGQRMPQCEVPVSNQGPLEIEIQKMIALCEQMHPKYRFAMEARIKQLEWQLINQHN